MLRKLFKGGNYSRAENYMRKYVTYYFFFISITVCPFLYENQLFTELCHRLLSTYLLILFSVPPVCIKEPKNLYTFITVQSENMQGPELFFTILLTSAGLLAFTYCSFKYFLEGILKKIQRKPEER